MVQATSSIRWALTIWSVIAVLLVGWSIAAGASAMSVMLLAVACAAPLVVAAAVVRFTKQPVSATEVLHEGESRAR